MSPEVCGYKGDLSEGDKTIPLDITDRIISDALKHQLDGIRFTVKALQNEKKDSDENLDNLAGINDQTEMNEELQFEVLTNLFGGIDTKEIEKTETALELLSEGSGDWEQEGQKYKVLESDEFLKQRPSLRDQSKNNNSTFMQLLPELRTKLALILKYWSIFNFIIWTSFTATCYMGRTQMLGYVLVIWIFAVAALLGIYYHAKAVVAPTDRQVSQWLLSYLMLVQVDLGVRMLVAMELMTESTLLDLSPNKEP
eukprot:UN29943